MAIKRLSEKATFVQRGYGQVEPNHLSARRTGQIYAQLPADPSIDVLENGQFAIYDYAHGVVTTGKATVNLTDTSATDEASSGEWMLVLNEIKLYEDREQYEDFAMLKDNYNARVYSPIGQKDSTLNTILNYVTETRRENSSDGYAWQDPAFVQSPLMPQGSTMVPRLLKTNIGDIFTTNCVKLAAVSPATDPVTYTQPVVGNKLTVDTDGYLKITASPTTGEMVWQVVKVYTLADNQPAVKIQRIA